MLKLLKYEMRKTRFSKLILLTLTGVLEIAYLIGVFLNKENVYSTSIVFLVCITFGGIAYIGLESLICFHRDLNTKQSYMLFLTPRNSYQILGAKIIENGLSLVCAGLFFSLLAAADLAIGITRIGGLEQLLEACRQFLDMTVQIKVNGADVFITFMSALASWLMTITIGDLSIVLAATVLAGKKFSGFVSFLIFLVISYVCGYVIDLIPTMSSVFVRLSICICLSLVFTAAVYLATGWIMDKKLSV